jgi:peptidoglycan/LPS O-acetylase OafA/YrhL
VSTPSAPATATSEDGLSKTSSRIPTLDGWRGIAILMVLVAHGELALTLGGPAVRDFAGAFGQHGVAVFFVLSGFLITSVLLRESAQSGAVDLPGFYIRRAFRILPCAWAFVFFLLVVTATSHPKPYSTRDIAGCLLFFRNFVPSSGANETTTWHFWSLSIEEQFYLVWPLLLVYTRPAKARWISLIAAMAIAVYRDFHWQHLCMLPSNFATQYRADALLIGCAAALWRPKLLPWMRKWMAVPLLIVVAICIAEYSQMIPLRESAAIAGLLLVTSTFTNSALSRLLESKALRLAGKYSYSLYVWQQLMFFNVHASLALLMAVPAIAWFSYTFIESSLRQEGVRLANCRKKQSGIAPTISAPSENYPVEVSAT